MDPKAMFKIGYGLYILTAREEDQDNGCVINTLTQVTGDPCRVTIAVSKANHTHDMIAATGEFNVSVLTEAAPFDLFRRFGYASGREIDKFSGFPAPRAANGLLYIADAANACLSCRVLDRTDLGTHTLFLADVLQAEVLNSAETISYSYYQRYTKPAPARPSQLGWRCPMCGYFFEGDPLPGDFVCPWCKHAGSEFIKVNPDSNHKEEPVMQLKGSKTEANLAYAFAGESQARNKYTYFASVARKEGYEQIAAIFEMTANNEKEHAKLWFKALGHLGNTMENLVAAAAGEHEEWTEMYKNFSEIAAAEGFAELSKQLAEVAQIEKRHEKRYLDLLANLKEGEVFKKCGEMRWECRNCGHIHVGDAAPDLCPVCKHARSYFEIEAANY